MLKILSCRLAFCLTNKIPISSLKSLRVKNSGKVVSTLHNTRENMNIVETASPTQNVIEQSLKIVQQQQHGVKSGIPWLQQQMSVPRPVVICGPSGSGKSTLLKKLMEEFGDYFGFSISHTTRKPRPGEKPGKDYYFVDRAEMERSIANGEFLEFAVFSGNMYGTSKKSVKRVQEQGRICILDIEIEGVKNIKKTDLNARFIFIKPPSIKILEERLRGRGTESEESIQKRLFKAQEELRYGEVPGNFDFVLVNDDVEETYRQLRNFLLNDIKELRRKTDEETGDH